MDMKNDTDKFVIGRGRPHWLTCWWQRTRLIEAEIGLDGLVGAPCEFYIPWWAWPLELAHWAIFGRPILGKLDE